METSGMNEPKNAVRNAYKNCKSSGNTCVIRGCMNNGRKLKIWRDAICEIPEHGRLQHVECPCLVPYSFHRFPANPELRIRWTAAVNVGRKDFALKSFSRICSAHFVDMKPTCENPVPTLKLGCTSDYNRVIRKHNELGNSSSRKTAPRRKMKLSSVIDSFSGEYIQRLPDESSSSGSSSVLMEYTESSHEVAYSAVHFDHGAYSRPTEKLRMMSIGKQLTSKQLRSLQFRNPGKFMEDFDPERSSREMRKVHRRIYTERSRRKALYDEKGLLIANRRDLCDCLNKDCMGCHYPCPKCGSEKCGAECRCNRTWCYAEIEVEGTSLKFVNDMK